ncbi:MAG: hypothetical protein HYZ84_05640 [Candidatus Omnitrophica bacterium]|nr:hypothetical protein [Candidatus Omnitrophota bacterium]
MREKIFLILLIVFLLQNGPANAQEKQIPYTKEKSAYHLKPSKSSAYFNKTSPYIRKPTATSYVSSSKKNPYALKSSPYFTETKKDGFLSELGKNILSTLNVFRQIINNLG